MRKHYWCCCYSYQTLVAVVAMTVQALFAFLLVFVLVVGGKNGGDVQYNKYFC